MSTRKPQRPDVEAGDHVYVRHPTRGPMAVKVLATGEHGLTGTCDKGERHQVTWDRYLGHKARMTARCRVVDAGADGAILEDERGRRRFVAGALPEPDKPAAPTDSQPERDDPLLGGMDRLTKAMTNEATMLHDLPEGSRILFLKAGPIAQRAGLALKEVTDKAGHQTKRWTKTNPDQPANDSGKGPAPMRHGDVIAFRHKNVEGRGKIVASGADGVTVQSEDGREHQVRHEHLVQAGEAVANDDEAPKAGKVEAAGDTGPGAAAGGGGAGDGPGDGNPPPVFSKAEVAPLPDTVAQPVKDKEELYAKGQEALAHLKSWLDEGKGVCDQLGYQTMSKGMDGVDWSKPGGMLFIAPLKGEKRAAEKVASDYGGDWSQLRDVVRCSIAVDTMDDLKSTLDALKKNGLELAQKPKDRFNKPLPVGYRDLMMIAKAPNGMCMEVQLHVKAMLAAKEEGHHYYEIERTLDAKAKAAYRATMSDRERAEYEATEGKAKEKLDELHGAKGRQLLDEDDRATLKMAQDKQREIYNNAWEAASAPKGEEPMSKAMDEGEEPLGKSYSYFDKDGAKFRRQNNGLTRSVDDVLHNGKWVPYQGDCLEPALYGDEIGDPLAKGGEAEADSQEPLAKALDGGKRVLFIKGR